MPTSIIVREGSLEPIIFQFKKDNANVNLAGSVVKMKTRSEKGVEITYSTDDMTPVLFISSETEGKVTLVPESGTWEGEIAGWAYTLYFDVKISGKFYAFPEDSEILVNVRPAY